MPVSCDGCPEHFSGQLAGKRCDGRLGLADSFNMVIMAFFAAIDLVLLSLWHLVSVSGIDDERGCDAAVIGDHDVVCRTVGNAYYHFGEQIIDFVAGDATTEVKHWR